MAINMLHIRFNSVSLIASSYALTFREVVRSLLTNYAHNEMYRQNKTVPRNNTQYVRSVDRSMRRALQLRRKPGNYPARPLRFVCAARYGRELKG